jgi:hypothetical protein
MSTEFAGWPTISAGERDTASLNSLRSAVSSTFADGNHDSPSSLSAVSLVSPLSIISSARLLGD